MSAAPKPVAPYEILDLRHFSAAELGPLLRDEAVHWNERLHWEYTQSVDLLLEYLESRILPGFVALDYNRRLLGYTFAVYEGAKAVVGDVYAFQESGDSPKPVCETLLTHLLEMLQATPGVSRIESQLLMFPSGSLDSPFRDHGFRPFERLFMLANLEKIPAPPALSSTSALRLERWRPEHLNEAATLIHRCYLGHEDAQINDQYQTEAGAARFLQNVIRFPGCGIFDPEHSLLLRETRNGTLQAVLLASRVRPDTAHITQLCVSPALRGLGLGRYLLTQCAADLRRRNFRAMSLTVTADNTPARTLYEWLGFETRHHFQAMTWNQ